MADFMELVENIRAEEADVKKLFGGEGTRVRGGQSPEYLSKLAEAAEFVADIVNGKRGLTQFQEAMSTSDFPLLFGDVLDRQMLASYRETPQSFRSWCRIKSVPDFRTVSRRHVDGGDSGLEAVSEYGEYKQVGRSEGEYTYSVGKYGNAFDISWETLINDDVDALKDQPERFGRAARRQEEKFATELIADSTGPNATFFTSGQGNRINDVLSVVGLTNAFKAMGAMKDANSQPILNSPSILMVPPALEVVAMNILNSLEFTYNGDGTTVEYMKVANWVKSKLTLVVNHYLPIVDTTKGDTAWYLFANPNEGRGAVEFGFLRGHEEPEIFMKAPNAQRVGGGLAGVMDGDFEHDSIMYKVRHVMGGTTLDYRYALASEGDGA